MWKIFITCVFLVGFTTSASHQKRYINNGRGYAPDYGFTDPYEFHQKLSQQIMDQQYQQNRALSSVFTSDDGSAFAEASNVADFDEIFQEQFAHQQRLFDNIRQQSLAASGIGSRFGGAGAGAGSGAFSGASSSGYGSGYGPGYGSGSGTGFGTGTSYNYGPDYGSQSGYNPGFGTRFESAGGSGSYAPNYASASGSYGPGGGYQTASIFPENPNVPNINSRFDDSDNGGNSAGGGGNGFRGVSVSSYSSSSDVNGKKTNHRGATTTINDNGKVTTYHVNS